MSSDAAGAEPEPLPIAATEDELEALRQAAIRWLETRWVRPWTCPVCRHANWAVGSPIVSDIWSPRGRTFPGSAYVYVPVSCTTCAYTRLFNAIQMGIIPVEPPRDG